MKENNDYDFDDLDDLLKDLNKDEYYNKNIEKNITNDELSEILKDLDLEEEDLNFNDPEITANFKKINEDQNLIDDYNSRKTDDKSSCKLSTSKLKCFSNFIYHNPIKLILFICFIAIISSALIYNNTNKKMASYEKEAIKNTADIGAALFYASLVEMKNQSPQINNYSEPEMLGKYIQKVLPQEDNSINHQNYTFYVRTDDRLKNFCVFAIPKPTLWHKIIPQKSFLVDSMSMQLREISNLIFWKSFLSYNYSLENINNVDLKNNILQEKPQQINFFETNKYILKNSSRLKIYNLPRYREISSYILQNDNLQNYIIEKHPELVLYLQDEDSYNTYLNSTNQYRLSPQGKIIGIIKKSIPVAPKKEPLIPKDVKPQYSELEMEIQATLSQHKDAMGEIINSMQALLIKQSEVPQKNFNHNFLSLEQELLLTAEKQNNIFLEKIRTLAGIYPTKTLLPSLEKFNLNDLWEDSAPKEEISTKDATSAKEAIAKIQESDNLIELYNLVEIAHKGIATSQPNNLQSTLQSEVLIKLGSFILSPNDKLKGQLKQNGAREMIEKTLVKAYIEQEYEREFYLQEFDSLMSQEKNIEFAPKEIVENISEKKIINKKKSKKSRHPVNPYKR